MKVSKSALLVLLASERASSFSTCTSSWRRGPCSRGLADRISSLVPLHGLLDEINSDAFDLSSSSSPTDTSDESNMVVAYETLLGDLVFSTTDPRIDIVNKIDLCTDPKFLSWLNQKIEKSNDPEERLGLKDLEIMILDVKTKVDVNRLSEERASAEKEKAEEERLEDAEKQAEQGRQMSTSDIFSKANEIDNAGINLEKEKAEAKKKINFYEQEITPEIRLSYDQIMKKVLPPYKPGETAATIAFANYEQFDAQLVKLLNERATVNDDVDSKNILSALAVEQQKRVAVATDPLRGVLAMGEPMKMEGALVRLARENKIDETFLLLLEANADQARNAGANGPAQLMDKLRKRAIDEKDKQASSKEIRLLRQLLRTDDPKEREKIIESAFEPKNALIVPGTAENAAKAVDGEVPEQEKPMPDVPPPDFIDACKAVMLNFGNLGYGDSEKGDLASRIKQIASEAEVVATRIYGQGMTLREQQDNAWKDSTTSIFDLEKMEIEAERMGGRAPWTDPNASEDDLLPPGFDTKGRMKVGGS